MGEPLRGHLDSVYSVAVGLLADGTSVVVSGGSDGSVRVWRLADGMPLVPALDLAESVRGLALYDGVVVSAAGADISAHQPTLLPG